jgi:hypothetical protein
MNAPPAPAETKRMLRTKMKSKTVKTTKSRRPRDQT